MGWAPETGSEAPNGESWRLRLMVVVKGVALLHESYGLCSQSIHDNLERVPRMPTSTNTLKGHTAEANNILKPMARKRTFLAVCAVHALHDGYTDLLYVLFPIWQVEFGIGYGVLALFRGVYYGTMAAAQIPVNDVTRGVSAKSVLVAGTLVAACGFFFSSAGNSVWMLYLGLLVAGIGSSTQHPRGSDLIVRSAQRQRRDLAVYNFAGDVGKALFPAATALCLGTLSWTRPWQ
jgi:hypothetical protein